MRQCRADASFETPKRAATSCSLRAQLRSPGAPDVCKFCKVVALLPPQIVSLFPVSLSRFSWPWTDQPILLERALFVATTMTAQPALTCSKRMHHQRRLWCDAVAVTWTMRERVGLARANRSRRFARLVTVGRLVWGSRLIEVEFHRSTSSPNLSDLCAAIRSAHWPIEPRQAQMTSLRSGASARSCHRCTSFRQPGGPAKFAGVRSSAALGQRLRCVLRRK